MLTYHPALDPYHTALRILTILSRTKANSLPQEMIRILDFYLLFPNFISSIRFPRDLSKWRKPMTIEENPYFASGNPHLLFQHLRPVQDSAFNLLTSKGIIEVKDPRTSAGEVNLIKLNSEVEQVLNSQSSNDQSELVLKFITEHLALLPLTGKDGLKNRSGLMESRYDAA